MDLSIIIVNWNSRAYLEKCLTSIYSNANGLNLEVIVIDNASFDGSADMIRLHFPEATFIQSHRNLGFSGANNQAFEASTGDVLLFLNPDTEIVGGAVEVLFHRLQSLDDSAVVGARLLNTDGTVQTSCIQRFPSICNQILDAELLRTLFPKLALWGMAPLREKQPSPVPVEVISGACLMIRRRDFERVGRFSTRYFMYSEDVDLCYRATRTGLQNYYVDDAIVVHHGGKSSDSAEQSHFCAVAIRDSLSRYFACHRGQIYSLGYRAAVALSAIARCSVLGLSLLLRRQERLRLRKILSRWTAILKWAVGMPSFSRDVSGMA